jgi:VIT1/CCC1 family predicted Fe2+/Mn2+ transporter
LRAAVLGANDGIVSTASLLLGVGAAHATHAGILTARVSSSRDRRPIQRLLEGLTERAAAGYTSITATTGLPAVILYEGPVRENMRSHNCDWPGIPQL